MFLVVLADVGDPGAFVLGGFRMSMAECGWVVLNRCIHSAVATSTALLSRQGYWLWMTTALCREFSVSARVKSKGVVLGTYRGARLGFGQNDPVADGAVLYAAVASDAPG